MATVIAPSSPARIAAPPAAGYEMVSGEPRIRVRPPIPVVYPADHTDQLIIVEASGNQRRLAEVRAVSVESPSWVLNGVGSMGFSCSTSNPAMEHFVIPGTMVDGAGVMRLVGREVQLWRDGDLWWAGPPISASVGLDGSVSFTCMDLGWYLFRKFFGAAERRDLLLGIGSMDRPGLPGWAVSPGCVKANDWADKVRGEGSMSLTGGGAVRASFVRPTTTLSEAMAVHATAMVKIPGGTPLGTGVMTISVWSLDGVKLNQRSVVVDEQTTFDRWQRVATYAMLPPRAPHRVEVALWSLGTHGATKFDDVRSLENNTTGIPEGADLTAHGVNGVRHVQDGRGQTPGFGLTPVVLSETGTVEILGERHLNHLQFQDFLARYTDRTDGFDWRIDAYRRQIQFAHRIGADHRHTVLHDRNTASGGWKHDESQIASKIVVPGEGDGVDRPEGGYTDTSRTAGLVLDYFHQPPAGTPLSALDPMAREVWEQRSQPQISYDGLAVSDRYLGTIRPGDTVPSRLRSGFFRTPDADPMRIGEVKLDVAAGQLVLT